jgi:hypothetical protein
MPAMKFREPARERNSRFAMMVSRRHADVSVANSVHASCGTDTSTLVACVAMVAHIQVIVSPPSALRHANGQPRIMARSRAIANCVAARRMVPRQ